MSNIINIIRRNFSSFITKNKPKLKDLGKKLIIVAIAICFATIILSSLSNNQNRNEEDKYNPYNPTDTTIKGSDISEEEFKEDSNLVNTFLEFCNNKNVEDAYYLVSDECKEEKYPTIEEFKEFYYDYVFDRKRECVLQAWISTSDYIVYKVRYTNDMLSSGTYDENNVYQDYITLNRKNNTEKISIGSFVDLEKCNIITKTKEIEATVVNKKIYIEDEEYEIDIKNNTDKTILLDNLKSNTTIWLTANGMQYKPYSNKMFVYNFTIEPGETQTITLRFMKNLSTDKKSKAIQFLNVIKDYDAYKENETEYRDVMQIKIKVED